MGTGKKIIEWSQSAECILTGMHLKKMALEQGFCGDFD